MKQDLENHLNYLKTLRVSSKFIQPCNCMDKDVHTYCMTASIIHKKRIYCEKCSNYYKLFVKQEKLCSGQLLTLICNYIAVLIFTVGCIIGILIFDSYLKTVHAKSQPVASQQIFQRDRNRVGGFLGWLHMNPDYSRPFNIKKSVRWTDLIPMFLIILILILWCFFFHLNRVIMTRKKLIYVEVRAFDEPISRAESKQNLNLVIESNLKRKNNNMLFDKFWYQTRETWMVQSAWEGLYFDSRKYVTYSQPQHDAIDLVRDIQKTVIIEKEPFNDASPTKSRTEPKYEVNEIDASKEFNSPTITNDKNAGDKSLASNNMSQERQ